MNETLFYLLGIALVAAAVIVAFLGLRIGPLPGLEIGDGRGHCAVRGPGRRDGGLRLAQRRGRAGAPRGRARRSRRPRTSPEGDEGEAAEEVGSGVAADEAAEEAGATAAADGAQVFDDAGCGGCHTLADAGSTGTIGPDLDEALAGQSPTFIEESIVDPNATIAQGFTADVMPQTYGDDLAPEELEALVAYLSESTGSGLAPSGRPGRARFRTRLRSSGWSAAVIT